MCKRLVVVVVVVQCIAIQDGQGGGGGRRIKISADNRLDGSLKRFSFGIFFSSSSSSLPRGWHYTAHTHPRVVYVLGIRRKKMRGKEEEKEDLTV